MALGRTMAERYEAFENAKSIGNYLKIYFEKNEGVRLGDCCVASLKMHELGALKGHVKILTNQDAGQFILDYIDPGMVVNICVFHKPGVVDPVLVARKIWESVEDFMTLELPHLTAKNEEKFNCITEHVLKLYVTTRGGKGMVSDVVNGKVEPIESEERGRNYVQILGKLSSDKYGLIVPIIEAVEESISETGLELGKVKKITHAKGRSQEETQKGISVPVPWRRNKFDSYQVMKEAQNQLIMKLAEKFASIEDLEDFMDSFSTKLFKRTAHLDKKKKWADIEDRTQELKDLDLVKNSLMGPVLTQEGKAMKEFLINHRCELEAEMRRQIRQTSGSAGNIRKLGTVSQKVSCQEFTNRNKTMRLTSRTWTGDLAVPDTVIQARKGSLMRRDGHFTIQKDDLFIYRKRSYVPINICLLIDASGSMAGEKRDAACYLAQHLLLTGREKVAVVTFQEMRGKVVVPFTRKQQEMLRGLNRIVPVGMTPLADGIVTAVDLIASTRVRNPVIVLITDGLPNYPLWTFDSQRDGLEAAALIPKNKIRLICIGVEANQYYLERLSEEAKGKLFVVDDLNRNNLINIVKHEKKLLGMGERILG